MNKIQETCKSQLQEINGYYKAIVDYKLSKLSGVLDEIKISQEELAKYRQLLRSLTADLNTEQ